MKRSVMNPVDRVVSLPKWAQGYIRKLEERVARAEATIPWTEPGMEWFTLFWPGPEPKARAPQKLFTCGDGGTHCVCTLGPEDWVFVGRGNKPSNQYPNSKDSNTTAIEPTADGLKL